MPAPYASQQQSFQEVPLTIVGGNKFGRYPKISDEQTWNMIVSDSALVDYAAYKNILPIVPSAKGRGIYASTRGNIMVVVWDNVVYKIKGNIGEALIATEAGVIGTSSGDVFFAENNSSQIAITDGQKIYIYNWTTFAFGLATVPTALKNPGYISFQNGRFIVVNTTSNAWYLSDPNSSTFSGSANTTGALQSKPDLAQAALPMPGGGNNLLLFGKTVVEQWQDVGAALFSYRRSSTFNVDYGVLNASSIASLDNYVVWLGNNEQSGIALMAYDGRSAKSISTDGIDFKMANLSNPGNCTGFLFRQDGHVIYQFTFPDDNLSYIYDFNTQLFCTVSDENNDYHIARNVVFYNNVNYFVSLKGGNLYAFGTQYTNYDYGNGNIQQMPRLRVTPPVRLPSQRFFIVNTLGFTVENGQPNDIDIISHYTNSGPTLATENLLDLTTEDGVLLTVEGPDILSNVYTLASEAIDLSVSRDGGESFGNSIRRDMNPVGKRKSRFIFQRLGRANDVTFQIRFIGYGRFVALDGVLEIYQ